LVTIDELVEQSDFIILSIALNEDTKFIINKERIAKMKSHVVLVNIGRGGKAHYKHAHHNFRSVLLIFEFSALIDQDALIEALQENRIGGAGLDVMTPEPLPLDSPLMKMDNVGMYNKILFCYMVYINSIKLMLYYFWTCSLVATHWQCFH